MRTATSSWRTWARLVLALLALTGTSAWARPPAVTEVTAAAAGGAPPAPAQRSAHLARFAQVVRAPAPSTARAVCDPRPAASAHPRGPPPPQRRSRLFLLHRALLR